MMIDYEVIAAREAISQTAAALGDFQASHIFIYLTILFAYLTVAYFAGKNLTRLQLALVTFLFIAASAREVVTIASAGVLFREKMGNRPVITPCRSRLLIYGKPRAAVDSMRS